jgi:Got1/Sft2-like family
MVLQEIRKSADSALDRAKQALNRNGKGIENGGDEEASQTSQSQASDQLEALSEYCPQLTFQQRLIGFAVCFTIGHMIAFFSFRFFIRLVEGNPVPFALNYTFGHILQLLASTFLCGPKRQFKSMFDDKRRITTIAYLSCCAYDSALGRPGKVPREKLYSHKNNSFLFLWLYFSGRQSPFNIPAIAGPHQTDTAFDRNDCAARGLFLVLALLHSFRAQNCTQNGETHFRAGREKRGRLCQHQPWERWGGYIDVTNIAVECDIISCDKISLHSKQHQSVSCAQPTRLFTFTTNFLF